MKARSLTRPVSWTAFHAFLWLIPITALLVIVPRFERLFTDFGVDLPSGTVWAIKGSHAIVTLLPVVILALLVLLAADFAIIRKFQGSSTEHSAGVGWVLLMTALPLGLIVFVSLSIVGPWSMLRQKLSG